MMLLWRKPEPFPKIPGPNSSTCRCGTVRSHARRKSSPRIPKSQAAISIPPRCSAITRRWRASSPRSRQTPPPKATRAIGTRLHLCFSRFLRLEPARSEGFLKAATALLNAGASPNTGFFEESHQPTPEWECALYGAAGVAHHAELTKLLLDRGADPNDEEVAYRSPETLDNRTIHVLVESGKLTQDTIGLMLNRKFNWHDDDGVHWLLEHGADPNWPLRGSRPLHYALRLGTPIYYFEWLLDHGADPLLPDKDETVPVAEAARQG